MNPPKIWIGVECTLNRVQDRFDNQVEKTAHWHRPEDIKLFSTLRAEKIYYPCLWEQVAPAHSSEFSWTTLDERLKNLKLLNQQPIACLLHHGSGPLDTSLLDPAFPEKFALYAKNFAQRYPWIQDFAPLHSPLLTARQSCLRGHWYPHKTDPADFLRALYNQCKAVVLATIEIKKITPEARFILSENVGYTLGTDVMAYQVQFDNEMRWLTFDLLCGKVTPQHPLFNYLQRHISSAELEWLRTQACMPDYLGVEHAPLSNRFLDHRPELYPAIYHDHNSKHHYANVPACETGQAEPPDLVDTINECWQRYKIPLIMAGVRVHGPREKQLRWLTEVWTSSQRLQQQGVQIRAITAGSLLGDFKLNSYEAGVFDLRTGSHKPRKTLMAEMVRCLAQEQTYSHPLLQEEKWKQNQIRMLYALPEHMKMCPLLKTTAPPVLITGGGGALANAFARICSLRNIPFVVVSKASLDITDPQSVKKILDRVNPWAIINAAGYVNIDKAEQEQALCYRVNVAGAHLLAEESRRRKIQFMSFSSDLVFDGSYRDSYTESQRTNPLNTYGRSKASAETFISTTHPQALVIRSSAFFGPWDQSNFLNSCFESLKQNKPFFAARDIFISPTYLPDLVHTSLDLLIDKESGIVHLVNEGKVSWFEFAALAHRMSGGSKHGLLISCTHDCLNFKAARPLNSSLTSERIKIMPPLDTAVFNYLKYSRGIH